jgi:hypothetical protein
VVVEVVVVPLELIFVQKVEQVVLVAAVVDQVSAVIPQELELLDKVIMVVMVLLLVAAVVVVQVVLVARQAITMVLTAVLVAHRL